MSDELADQWDAIELTMAMVAAKVDRPPGTARDAAVKGSA
jgi:hypothetical protein